MEGYFIDRQQPPLSYMKRLIRLLTANHDIKIQVREENILSASEKDRFLASQLL